MIIIYAIRIGERAGNRPMENQLVIVLDFGGQYKELIARRVRECNVCSVIKPGNMALDDIRALSPRGISLTGGPASGYCDGAPTCDPALFDLGIPILGICYGPAADGVLHRRRGQALRPERVWADKGDGGPVLADLQGSR
jgi:carbamoylphosphate synthase small subunit